MGLRRLDRTCGLPRCRRCILVGATVRSFDGFLVSATISICVLLNLSYGSMTPLSICRRFYAEGGQLPSGKDLAAR
jgi:hypothetical protein